MNNKIFGIIVVVVVIAAVLFWYSGKAKTKATTSGDVFVRDGVKEQPAPASQTKPADDQTAKDEKALAQQAQDQATVQPAAAPQAQTQPDMTGSMVPPASDSIARNPPTGMIFAGTGKFQLYRQGDLTWRLNTDSGQACIIFATDAQWRLARVYRNGCGRS